MYCFLDCEVLLLEMRFFGVTVEQRVETTHLIESESRENILDVCC